MMLNLVDSNISVEQGAGNAWASDGAGVLVGFHLRFLEAAMEIHIFW